MKTRYGQEFRKNIRFDDVGHTFCIDILIPGQRKWETVTYQRALLDCKSKEKEAELRRGNALSSQPTLNSSVDGLSGTPRPPDAGPTAGAGAGAAGDVLASQPMNIGTNQDVVWGANK